MRERVCFSQNTEEQKWPIASMQCKDCIFYSLESHLAQFRGIDVENGACSEAESALRVQGVMRTTVVQPT